MTTRADKIAMAGTCIAVGAMSVWMLNLWAEDNTPQPESTPSSAMIAGKGVTPVSVTYSAPDGTEALSLSERGNYSVGVTPAAPRTISDAPGAISATPATVSDAAATVSDAPAPTLLINWQDGYVPCDTPSGDTMVVGCYVDGAQPYVVTDDGETFLIDPATGARTYVEPGHEPWIDWSVMPDPESLPLCNAADDEACFYEGVSLGDRCDWVNSPGLVTTWFFNCDDPSLEGQVVDGVLVPTFPDVTLVPCEQEDSDDCYWDAARFGNHEGTSFIRLDGITYYPEAVK